ncbi:carbohydrate ABC transporter ATP-binding protein (CUT1 family) [Humibacillus xanthopallidus]|uniref:Carbohydrate ABC transporter ATP-binding protein (CUT1 family) n=1 Tax=Humibacillus xanthopallidus TaxID=412689 RepID=A0A543PLW4_9MICO|nr:sn-glycerol-3-phosphate ABC transporter ATP-binding protein UgpC [Humibacillus xanthopallidus]TQN45067.1 carbohydrate ABC transporter ATP-binding protein (CUT1 family) [Humibacillus xanthopallidus]
MASITYDKVRKVYPDGTEAIPAIDLEVKDGEFMVFVGPSGCGKSTALRMTAGLEDISSGRLYIGDDVVNAKSPQERDIAMVFQDYALYPHMTVRQNMGFALRMMRLPSDEIRRRVDEAAERLSLTALLERTPKNLSGGQRQRVAMGRAIVRQPAAFLMDEPLSNLDAKLRVQMRAEIDALQHQLGVTTLYVTHDQVEAMTMGDRVAVMKNGRIQQCAPPQELYENPANVFVAGFIGSPKMNLFHSVLRHDPDGSVRLKFGPQDLHISPASVARIRGLGTYPEGPITVGLRPESLQYTPDASGDRSIDVTVNVVEMLGNESLIHFVAPVEQASDADVRDRAQASDEEESLLAGAGSSVMVARLVPPVRLAEGQGVRLTVDTDRLYLFDAQGQALGPARTP